MPVQTPDRATVVALVLSNLRAVSVQAEPVAAEHGELTPLIGKDALLDSLGLVTLVIEVEQALEQQHGLTVALANDRAMSQRNSPFRTVGTLADYVMTLAGEALPR